MGGALLPEDEVVIQLYEDAADDHHDGDERVAIVLRAVFAAFVAAALDADPVRHDICPHSEPDDADDGGREKR